MEVNLDKYTIIIHQTPLEILERFAQHNIKAPEAGGIILGKLYENRIEIHKLSVPTSLDKANRYSFERNKVSAQIIIDFEFYNNNGQMIYLGEWHTHPEHTPTPSFTDLVMIKNQFKNNYLNTDFLLLMIKGTKNIYLRMINEKNSLEVVL